MPKVKANRTASNLHLQLKLMQRNESLRGELQEFLEGTGRMAILRHPFYNSWIDPNHAALAHRIIDQKQKMLKKCVKNQNWAALICLYEVPFLLDGFIEHGIHFDDASYWEQLAYVWTAQEQLWPNKELFLQLFTSPRSRRESLMDKSEHADFRKLPDCLSVYRGFTGRHSTGMSWTTDPDKAEWFARRFSMFGQPKLIAGVVRKADILAYFNRRMESEVVADPTKIKKGEVHLLS